MEANPVFAVQLLSALVFAVFLGLGARIVWRSYFSRNFQASFPNLMGECFDCSCPRGWTGPARRALRELSRLQKSRIPSLRVVQIKEKFGGLRIYSVVENYDPAIDSIIHHDSTVGSVIAKAERACYFRCQDCGKLGRLRVLHGWHATLCEKCEQDREAALNCLCPHRKEKP